MHPLAVLLAVLPVVVACVALTWHCSRLFGAATPGRVELPRAQVRPRHTQPRVPQIVAPPPIIPPPAPVATTTTPAPQIVVPAPQPVATDPEPLAAQIQMPDDDDFTFVQPIKRPRRFPLGSGSRRISEFDDNEETDVFKHRRPDVFDGPTRVVDLRARARR